MALVDGLMGEHRSFLVMLDVLDAAAARLARGHVVPVDVLRDLVDFFEVLTDGHHRREEHLLFPLLAQHGLGADQSVVHALLAQHETGRVYTARMRQGLPGATARNPEAVDAFVQDAKGYAELIREHIRIEDTYFYGLAATVLSGAEQLVVQEAFRMDGGLPVSEPDRDRYRRMIDELPAMAASWRADGEAASPTD